MYYPKRGEKKLIENIVPKMNYKKDNYFMASRIF